MAEQENVKDIFRHWTWKKFIVNFLALALMNLMITLIFESIEFLKSPEPVSISKLVRDVTINSLLTGILFTIWIPEKGSLIDRFKKKRNNNIIK